jgi:hypothetical protein
MITGPRAHFMARCLERGYSLESVRPCIVAEDGDTITVDPSHQAYPRERSPSLFRKAVNFAKSAARHAMAGGPRCTESQISERYAICEGCEFFKAGACVKCGCPVVREQAYISKLAWAGESCPVGKWGPVSPDG